MLLQRSHSESSSLSAHTPSSLSFDSHPPSPSPQLYGHKINIDNLIAICTSKLANNPHHRKALFIRATSFMKKQMFQEAIEDCHRLLNIDKRNVGAYYIMGCAYQKLEDT